MFDRCSFRVSTLGAGGPGWLPVQSITDAWSVREVLRLNTDGIADKKKKAKTPWRVYEHRAAGIRIVGPVDHGPLFVEASLSRILFGHNGCLLRTQQDVDNAVGKLTEAFRQVSNGSQMQILEVQSAELAWHFSGAPSAWIAFYSHLNHPRIEAAPQAWRDEYLVRCINPPPVPFLAHDLIPVSSSPTGVTWWGKRLRIKLYDKTAQMGCPSNVPPVMRLEYQAKDSSLKGILLPGGRLSFDAAYGQYRKLSGMFRSFRAPRGMTQSAVDFLILLWVHKFVPDHLYRGFLADQSRRTRYRYRERQRQIPEIWEMEPGIIARLPEDGPPAAPDVVPPSAAISG